jgi:hypothetical protein
VVPKKRREPERRRAVRLLATAGAFAASQLLACGEEKSAGSGKTASSGASGMGAGAAGRGGHEAGAGGTTAGRDGAGAGGSSLGGSAGSNGGSVASGGGAADAGGSGDAGSGGGGGAGLAGSSGASAVGGSASGAAGQAGVSGSGTAGAGAWNAACGDVTMNGRCVGEIYEWCDYYTRSVKQLDCGARGMSCNALSSQNYEYDINGCVGGPCNGDDAACDGPIAVECELGEVRARDCRKSGGPDALCVGAGTDVGCTRMSCAASESWCDGSVSLVCDEDNLLSLSDCSRCDPSATCARGVQLMHLPHVRLQRERTALTRVSRALSRNGQPSDDGSSEGRHGEIVELGVRAVSDREHARVSGVQRVARDGAIVNLREARAVGAEPRDQTRVVVGAADLEP